MAVLIDTRNIEGTHGIEYYAVSFPSRPVKRISSDKFGVMVDFSAGDQEIIDWCTQTFGLPDLWGETNNTWIHMNDVFYFSRDSYRMACILRWE